MRHGNNKFDRHPKVKQVNKVKKGQLKRWVSAYMEALFEDRMVEVLPKYQKELDLLLW